mmetsp:Transcript_47846/g.133411  ORF Transcript_47846/g.133411 Transcript_47846/m.133411 type:complete len:218 (+) Transcript_47846:1669-2322(+)
MAAAIAWAARTSTSRRTTTSAHSSATMSLKAARPAIGSRDTKRNSSQAAWNVDAEPGSDDAGKSASSVAQSGIMRYTTRARTWSRDRTLRKTPPRGANACMPCNAAAAKLSSTSRPSNSLRRASSSHAQRALALRRASFRAGKRKDAAKTVGHFNTAAKVFPSCSRVPASGKACAISTSSGTVKHEKTNPAATPGRTTGRTSFTPGLSAASLAETSS